MALLRLLLPRYTRVCDLPRGADTLHSWMGVWRSMDNCSQWDAMWLAIVTRLLRHSGLTVAAVGSTPVSSGAAGASPRVDGDGVGAAGSSDAFDARSFVLQHLPFLFSRVQVRRGGALTGDLLEMTHPDTQTHRHTDTETWGDAWYCCCGCRCGCGRC